MSDSVGANALKVVSERSERQLSIAKAGKRAGRIEPQQKVLEEEEFVERVEKIIERDFFPYLDEVKKQNNYLDALDSQDSVRITEAEKALQDRSVRATETPSKVDWDAEDWIRNTPRPSAERKPLTKNDQLSKELEGTSLSQFMAKNTSEDNASFKDILKVAEIERRKKLDWVYKHENEDKALMPPPAAPALALESKPLDGWNYKVHNAVMYNPEGAPLTAEEIHNLKEAQPKISHGATRLDVKPWNRSTPEQPQVSKKGDGFWNGVQKIGMDGKSCWEISSSPKVNGFSFVATPSPRPGVGESPLMTWGEIDGTPLRIVDSVTESSAKFKMNPPSAREQLALSLAEKNSVKKRQLKANKTKQTSAPGTAVPGSPSLSGLSPAAKRLAVGKLGMSKGVDKKLMKTYTPDRRSTKIGSTPSITPSFPSPSPRTPVETRSPQRHPARAKASDFF